MRELATCLPGLLLIGAALGLAVLYDRLMVGRLGPYRDTVDDTQSRPVLPDCRRMGTDGAALSWGRPNPAARARLAD